MTERPGPAISGTHRRRRILFLTPQLPYPPEQGTAIRNYNLIARIARNHDVALLSFADASHRPDAVEHLSRFCRSVVTVAPPSRTTAERLRDLFLTAAPDMARRLDSSSYEHKLRACLQDEAYDVLQIEGIEMAPYALRIRDWLGARAPRVVFDDHNAEYVLQQRAFETEWRSPRRWPAACYSLLQWQRLARFERCICRAADAVIAVSQTDAAALARLVPDLQPVVVPNGVDIAGYRPGLPDSLSLRHPAVVFTGKMDFRPNVDAMLWFHRLVWPTICASVPDAQLYVVGKNPHPRLRPLCQDPRVVITGYVEDILPYFGGADVYIAPLRIGGGTRLKVLEAMASGLPLVATSLGVEGIGLVPGRHALLADAPRSFAAAVVELLRDRDRAQALGVAARELVLERYDWECLIPRLDGLYASLQTTR